MGSGSLQVSTGGRQSGDTQSTHHGHCLLLLRAIIKERRDPGSLPTITNPPTAVEPSNCRPLLCIQRQLPCNRRPSPPPSVEYPATTFSHP